jgi:hypothetical protein
MVGRAVVTIDVSSAEMKDRRQRARKMLQNLQERGKEGPSESVSAFNSCGICVSLGEGDGFAQEPGGALQGEEGVDGVGEGVVLEVLP